MKSYLISLRPRMIALACLNVYVVAAALSIVIAHVLIIIQPASGWGNRIMAPVVNGLLFIDAHWRSFLVIAVVPFVAPLAQDLIPRIRKLGSLELDPVQLEPVAIREKPTSAARGDSK